MTDTIFATVTIRAVQCTCGIWFGVDAKTLADLRESHETFYCPKGHKQYFPGKSETERLQEEKERLERRVEQERSWRQGAERRTDRERRSHIATKGHLTRTKKRVAAGVCPCCKRSFKDLARHMAGQHPDYAADKD